MLSEHPTEGALLRDVFDRYLRLGNLGLLQKILDNDLRFRASRLGKLGRKTSTGALGHLLSNRVYIGDICSKGVCVAGKHDALVSRPVFDEVQKLLEEGKIRFRQRQLKSPSFELAGLVRNELGQKAHTSTGRSRRGPRYRYFVFRSRGGAKAQRMSAARFERCVRAGLDVFALWHEEHCSGPIRVRQREAIHEIVIRSDYIRVELCTDTAS